ncbi:right-handed parallel beta-helix repeat-containing protein [Halomarina oriensis]|uniref:Uncharacterized protein n=1 Tax=Halomarina oriensis TaxID=671145 RepID=A0A6B0GM58_9EURY|nr:right-handed parallel beta-helix repeat-containing protein [Halomarina oriensis]MWG33833.1 hypothetical protein [Halomarina oriensis]
MTHDNQGSTAGRIASRRSVLRTLGAAGVAGVAVATRSGSATAAPRGGFQFDRVVNMHEAGADPTGGEPVDPIVDRYTESGTLLLFPPGEYRLNQFNPGFDTDLENFGIRGVNSKQVTFVPREGQGSDRYGTGYADKLFINLWGVRNLLLGGFTVDCTAENTGGRTQLLADDGLVFRDVTFRGRHDVDRGPLLFCVFDEDGEGVVDRARLPDGSVGPDPNPVGVFVFRPHAGTLTFRNCHVEGFQDNGIYASAPDDPGVIGVEGGYYANNNVAGVRLGQSESYVKNATIVVDEVPDFWNRAFKNVNMRGIWQNDGEGMSVKNCEVVMATDVTSQGGIVSSKRSGGFTVENTTVRTEAPYRSFGISARRSQGEDGFGNQFEDLSVTLRNVSTTGDAPDAAAVDLRGRDGSLVENARIRHSGTGRDGIRLLDSDATVRNAVIDVAGEPIVAEGSDVTTRNVRYDDNGRGRGRSDR